MDNMLDEDDEENNDWWTKYFASLEAAAEVRWSPLILVRCTQILFSVQ